MNQLVSASVARERFYAVVLTVFAAVAGLLAVIGIYRVLAYAVVRRTREFGIRMALGARRRQVLMLVIRNGLVLASTGLLMGLAGATLAARSLQAMLFGVTPLDPWTFIAVTATVAAGIPAYRATMVEPTVALRCD